MDIKIDKPSFKIIVKAGMPRNEVLGFDIARQAYRIAVSEKAHNNKANIELIKFLSKLIGKPVRIIRGVKSSEKIIRVIG